MAAIDFIFIPLTLLAGHFIINRVVIRHKLQADKTLLIKLFYYHLAFSLLFAVYVTLFGGDSVGYWKHPGRFWRESGWMGLHATGTPFVYFLTYPFSQILGISFWGGTVLFTLFGFLGVVFFYLTLRRTLRVNPTLFGYKLFPLVLFLPNMHFWSGGVGKDSVIFFALCLFIFCLTNIKHNILLLILSFYLAFYIRPHIAMVMVVALGVGLLMSSRGVSTVWRVAFFALSIVTFVLIAPTVFNFIGIDQESIESYEDVSSLRSQNLSRSKVGSKIEITTMPVPLKMFTFLYRPLFFDGVNVLGLVVSAENLFYLLLTFAAIRWRTFPDLYRMPVVLKTCFVIAVASAYFLSSSMGNLGIIIRQKNMVMFMVVAILMYLIAERQGSLRKPTVIKTPQKAKRNMQPSFAREFKGKG